MLFMQQVWVSFLILSCGSIMCDSIMKEEFNDSVGVLTNCTLKLETMRQQLKLDNLINQGNRLITLDITIKWRLPSPNDKYPNHMTWFLTTDDTGKHLLALDDNFVVMSLGTLSYGKAEMKLSLLQAPDDCLGNASASEAETQLIYSLLTLQENSSDFDKDKMNVLRICTGSAHSNSNCCEASLLGKTVQCKQLKDVWSETFKWIIFILSMVPLSQIASFIPTSIFDDSEKRSFHILGEKLKVKVKVNIGNSNSYSNTEKNNCKFLNSVRQSIENKISSNGCDLMKQNETEGHVSCTFDISSVERQKNDLVSEFYPSVSVLQTLFILLREGCSKSYYSKNDYLCCSQYQKRIVMCLSILLFMSPLILRTLFLIVCSKVWVCKFIITINISFIVLSLIFILRTSEEESTLLKHVNESIKHVQQYTINDKIEACCYILYLPKRYCKKPLFKYGLLLFSFIGSVIYVVLLSVGTPIQFTSIFMTKSHSSNTGKVAIYVFILLFCYIGVFCLTDSVVFFTECFAYVLIGIFLNYKSLLDKIFLAAMILNHLVNCFTMIHRSVHCFNVKIASLVEQIHKEVFKTSSFAIALESREENKNTAKHVRMEQKNQNENVFKIVAGSDGNPCLSVNGLFIFHDFEDPDNLPIIHIPRQFIDTLLSIKSRFTPEPKRVLILRAVIGILYMIIATLMLNFTLLELMREDNESAIIHSVVSVCGSSAVIMLNKLLFHSAEPTFDDHDVHLKELIKRQMCTFEDSWEDITIGEVSLSDFHNNDSCCSDDCDFDAYLDTHENVTVSVKSFSCENKFENDEKLPKMVAELYSICKDNKFCLRKKGYHIF